MHTLLSRSVVLGVLFLVGLGRAGAQAPPPAAKFVAPDPLAPVPGSLVIVGGGKMPDGVRAKFLALAGGEKAVIVVVPTASADADKPDQADSFTKAWLALKPKSVTILHTRDRTTADSAEFVKPLADATAVWFSGGDQSRLTAAYRGTATEKAFHSLLARGGVVGGTSAGAAIHSNPMIVGGRDKAELAPGFGFLPGVLVDQHFLARKRQPRLVAALAELPGMVGIGIDEGTALLVTKGRQLEIVGDSVATILLSAGPTKPLSEEALKPGAPADLYQLRRAALMRTKPADKVFPGATVGKPIVKSGTLIIIGGGGVTPAIMNSFFDAIGGKDQLIVSIPAASEFADRYILNAPDEKFLKAQGATNVVRLHTRDRKKADDPAFSEVLTRAKGVWFDGGRQWRFLESYEGTLTEKRFHEVLTRGGAICGSSAGASIQGEYMARGHPIGPDAILAEGYERGFNFLPGVAIDQHFFKRKRLPDMTKLMKVYPQLLGIGIDETTAIVVKDSIAEVVGVSKVAIYNTQRKTEPGAPDYEELRAGDKYDLLKRTRLEQPNPANPE